MKNKTVLSQFVYKINSGKMYLTIDKIKLIQWVFYKTKVVVMRR